MTTIVANSEYARLIEHQPANPDAIPKYVLRENYHVTVGREGPWRFCWGMRGFMIWLACRAFLMYGECMSRKLTTTVRLDPDDAEALARARADGLSTSELIRKGLRVVASRYYKNRRPPSTGLFVSTDMKLGEDSELFRDMEE